jgi:hypothetical protein
VVSENGKKDTFILLFCRDGDAPLSHIDNFLWFYLLNVTQTGDSTPLTSNKSEFRGASIGQWYCFSLLLIIHNEQRNNFPTVILSLLTF